MVEEQGVSSASIVLERRTRPIVTVVVDVGEVAIADVAITRTWIPNSFISSKCTSRLMEDHQISNLIARVRFPLGAPQYRHDFGHGGFLLDVMRYAKERGCADAV